jgi:glutathione S-transferase
MIQFYDYPLSGNCFKVRFLLEQLGLEYQSILVDFYPGYEHKSPRFLNINPLGQLPAIMDKGRAVRDAQAILVYLAAAYDKSGKWFPRDHQGEVYQWLAFADQLTGSISAARLHDAMFYRLDVSKARTEGIKLLRIIDEHLWFAEKDGHDWLLPLPHPTIADVACLPYIALAEEGGIDLAPFFSVSRWMERFMRLENFKPMPGMMPLQMPKETP